MVSKVETYRGYDIYKHEAKEGHYNDFPVYCAVPSGSPPNMGGTGVIGMFKSASSCRNAIDKKLPPKEPIPPPPVESGKNYVCTYRGVNIYQYYGKATNYTCKYGSSTDLNTVKWLIDQNLDQGAPPDILRPPEDVYKDVEDSTDKRTDEDTYKEVKPRVVDTYNGIDVIYHPNTGLYTAKVGDKEKYCEDIDAAHAFIDHEQYVNSNQFKIDQEKKKAEEEEALRQAFLSEEEARKEAEAKERETKGGWFSIFWFKLKSEFQKTLEMLKL